MANGGMKFLYTLLLFWTMVFKDETGVGGLDPDQISRPNKDITGSNSTADGGRTGQSTDTGPYDKGSDPAKGGSTSGQSANDTGSDPAKGGSTSGQSTNGTGSDPAKGGSTNGSPTSDMGGDPVLSSNKGNKTNGMADTDHESMGNGNKTAGNMTEQSGNESTKLTEEQKQEEEEEEEQVPAKKRVNKGINRTLVLCTVLFGGTAVLALAIVAGVGLMAFVTTVFRDASARAAGGLA